MEFFRKDARVSHLQLGTGVVVEANRRYTTIAFDDGAVRKFVTALVRLERSTRPVPEGAVPGARRQRRQGSRNDQKAAS